MSRLAALLSCAAPLCGALCGLLRSCLLSCAAALCRALCGLLRRCLLCRAALSCLPFCCHRSVSVKLDANVDPLVPGLLATMHDHGKESAHECVLCILLRVTKIFVHEKRDVWITFVRRNFFLRCVHKTKTTPHDVIFVKRVQLCYAPPSCRRSVVPCGIDSGCCCITVRTKARASGMRPALAYAMASWYPFSAFLSVA